MTNNCEEILVLLPALNEEESLPGVLQSLRAQGLTRIRVVDNGSTDATAERARAEGAEVVAEPRRGYGQACWTGLQNLPPGIEWILFCDADGSDDPADLPRLLAARAEADFVLGNRRATPEGRSALTPVQNFGNWLATTLIRLGWGQPYQDLGPLRLIRREALEQIAMQDRGFGWTLEMQVRAVELGLRVAELPVNYRPRQGGQSKISGTLRGSFRAGIIILSTLLKLYGRAWVSAGRAWSVRENPSLSLLNISAALLLLMGCWRIQPYGDLLKPGHVPPFLGGMVILFAAFILLLRSGPLPPALMWGTALAARLVLWPMAPGDDLYRYIWEGRVLLAGLNPYELPPMAPQLECMRDALWQQVNHIGVTALYPPPVLGLFALLAAVQPQVWFFKLAIIGADVAVLAWLWRHFGATRAALYGWNPLVLYSFAGGGHYDSFFLLALCLGWSAWRRGAALRTGLAAALACSLKYGSCVQIPWLWWQACPRGRFLLGFGTALGLLLGLGFALFSWSSQPWTIAPWEFLRYVRSAEFWPWLAEISVQHHAVRWACLALLVGGLGLCAWRCRDYAVYSERALGLVLLLSPAVHLWYFTWLVPFAVRTRHAGTLAVSLSGFVYFWLQHKTSLGEAWRQSTWEWALLWLPFVLGWAWTEWKQRAERNPPAV